MRPQQAGCLRKLRRAPPLLQRAPRTVGLPALRTGPAPALLALRQAQADRDDHRPRTSLRWLRTGSRPRTTPLPDLPVLAPARSMGRRRATLLDLRRGARDRPLPGMPPAQARLARRTVPTLRTHQPPCPAARRRTSRSSRHARATPRPARASPQAALRGLVAQGQPGRHDVSRNAPWRAHDLARHPRSARRRPSDRLPKLLARRTRRPRAR